MARLWQKLKQAVGTDNVPYPESNPLSKTGKKILANMNKKSFLWR